LTAGEANSFGDRHHRPDPGGKLRDEARRPDARIRIRVSPQLAMTRVGQLGAWLCVNLICRLQGLVAKLELDVPAIAAHPVLKTLGLNRTVPGDLRACLADLTAAVAGHCVALGEVTNAAVDLELVIGGAELDVRGGQKRVWCFGSGWRASVGTAPTVSEAEIHDDSNPLGMYLAICFGVGEVFKAFKGFRGDQNHTIERLYVSLWSGVDAEQWTDLEDGPPVSEVRLPASYLVGAGAVAQGALLAVATATAGAEHLTPVDGDSVGETNRNRYVLTFAEHAGAQVNKAQLAAQFATVFNIPSHSEPLFWMPYLERIEPHPDARLRTHEADLRYELVVSCVDRNRARHEIQRTWPRDILGASTEGLRAQAVHYDLRTSTACLACHNPVLPFEAVVDSLREAIRDLPDAQRRARLTELEVPADLIRSVLTYLDNPKCGELGEKVLRKFAEDGPPGFAVGFVSVAAGLLLARHWIRFALFGPGGVTPPHRHYLTMNFLNGRFLWREESQNPECDCMTSGRARWRVLWLYASCRVIENT
jgi:molybdopterin/thiamine biosynthesis adenylyltransferase